MERFKNILFASIGGKDDLAAVARANRLAITNQARLTLVRVIEELPIAASYFLSKKRLAEFKETSQHLAQKELDKLSQKIDPSLKVETKVLFGKPFIELIRMAVGHSHDLIIKPETFDLQRRTPGKRRSASATQESLPGIDNQAQPKKALRKNPYCS